MEKNMFLNLLDIKKSLKNLTSSEENFEKATSPLYSDKDKEKYLEQAKKQAPQIIPEYHKYLRELMPAATNKEKSKTHSAPDKRGSSGAKKYAALFAKHHKPETDILLKPAANIGAAEIEKARRFSMFENNNPQLGKEIDAKIEDWYNTIYGTAPLRRDGTGRQIEPAIKIRSQSNGKLSTKDGLDLEQSLWKLAERMSEIDNDDTSETGVAALQKSLNNLGAKPPLKTDGQLGPKTTLQTRRQLADNGYLPLMKTLS